MATSPTSLLVLPVSVAAEGVPLRAPEDEVLHLFDTMRPALLRYAISFGLSQHDSEDILQETFLALFHHLLRNGARQNLHGWLFRVTHNLALKRRTKLGRQNLLHTDDSDLAEQHACSRPGPEAQLLFDERQQRLYAIFLALPQNDRLCLQLRAEGLTYREIAHVVQISLGSVAASIARGMAKLVRMEEGRNA